MKHRTWIAVLVCAALLLGSFPALCEEMTAIPDVNATAREIVLDTGEYVQRVQFLLDDNGTPLQVMERFEFTHPVTDAEQQAIAANYQTAPQLSRDGQTVYALWTNAEVANTFSGMDVEAFFAYLSAVKSAAAVYQTTVLTDTLYQSGRFTLSLDALHFSPRFGLTLSCTITNGYQKTTMSALLTECIVDGLYLPLAAKAPVRVSPGQSVTFLAPVTWEGIQALYLLGVESVGSISVRYRILDESGQTVRKAVSDPVAVSTASPYMPAGDPIIDEQGLRVYDMGFDAASGQVSLLFERTKGRWYAMRVAAVFDKVQEGAGMEMFLRDGQRWLRTFAANHPVSGIDVYMTPDYTASLRKPIQLTLGSPAPMEEQASAEAPLWTAGGCEVRYAGVSADYFSDSDALLFECINRNESTTYWLYPSFGYVYLDGTRMRVRTAGTECFPATRCTVAVAVKDLGATDLSVYKELGLNMGLYVLKNNQLKQRFQSKGLYVPLR